MVVQGKGCQENIPAPVEPVPAQPIRFALRADPALHPSHIRGMTHFIYPPGAIRTCERSSPNTKNVHHTISADVDIPQGGPLEFWSAVAASEEASPPS
jgi:hypothetical protein